MLICQKCHLKLGTDQFRLINLMDSYFLNGICISCNNFLFTKKVRANSSKKFRNRQARDYELIALAYHEAGHAVLATFHFMKVTSVKITNEKEMDGSADWTHLWDYENFIFSDSSILTTLVSNDVEMAYSGFIAEKIYYKDICGSDRFPQTLKYGSESDIYNASSLIKKYNLAASGRDRFLFKKKIQNNVTSLLTENWDAIKMVAHALYKKRRLNFDELKNVLTRKTKNKFLWREKYKQIELLYNHKGDISESELKVIISK